MTQTSCRLQTLAEGGLSKIAFCHDCQVFHLQVGYTTLHVKPEAFASLGSAIGSALTVYRRQNAEADNQPSNPVGKLNTALH